MQVANRFLLIFLMNGTCIANVPQIADNELVEVIEKIVSERIEGIQTKFDHLSQYLRSKVESLENENHILKKKIEVLETAFEEMKKTPEVMDRKMPCFRNRTTKAKTTKSGKYTRVAPARIPVPKVAFQANLGNNLVNVGPTETIIFDHVSMNIGNNYNHVTGIFTCEVPGVYVFHASFLLYVDKQAEVFLVKNGQPFGWLYAGDKDYLSGSSNIGIVELEKNDSVWVKVNQYHSAGTLAENEWTYISGFLLYPNSN